MLSLMRNMFLDISRLFPHAVAVERDFADRRALNARAGN
jgi:hypothetical protein